MIETATTRIVVDTGPDLRQQLLDAGVGIVDAVLWTHDHADHCHGIDDLRQIYHARGAPVPGFAHAKTLAQLERRFHYAFHGRDGYPPSVSGRAIDGDLTIGDVVIRTVDQPHGSIFSSGFRFDGDGKSIGYSTDTNRFTEEMTELFAGVDTWIVDALRREPHPTHAHLARTLDAIAAVKPGLAVLTHMDQSMDYRTLIATLPQGVVPAYDGMEVQP